MVLITEIGERSPFLTSQQFFVPAGSVLVIVYGLVDSFGGIPQQHSATISLIAGVIAGILAAAPWVEAVPATADKKARDADVYASRSSRKRFTAYRF